MATTATAHEPPTAPEPAAWRVAREQKRKERAALIPEEWRLSAEQLASVPQTDVPAWLDASGLFSDAELRLTSLPGWRVAELIANNQVTCEEATRAICHRAAVAHQITNCLTEIMFDDAIKRWAPTGRRKESKQGTGRH